MDAFLLVCGVAILYACLFLRVTDSPIFSTRQPGGMLALVNRAFFPGKIFYVDSGHAATSDTAGFGQSPETPVATLDYAIALCENDRGDVIFVMPGHAETMSTVTIDITDVTIIGLGQGKNKPTFTFDTTTDEFNVTADDVTIRNLRFVSGVNSLVNFIDADAHNLIIEDCDFETSSTKEAVCFINFATTKDWLTIRRCTALQPSDPEGTDAAAGTGFLYLVDSENIIIRDCHIDGSFETAVIHNKTTKCQKLRVWDCHIRQGLSGGEPFILVDGTTGDAHNSTFHTPSADDATVAKVIGTIGTLFWISGNCWFSNDSAAGGELMIASAAACS